MFADEAEVAMSVMAARVTWARRLATKIENLGAGADRKPMFGRSPNGKRVEEKSCLEVTFELFAM